MRKILIWLLPLIGISINVNATPINYLDSANLIAAHNGNVYEYVLDIASWDGALSNSENAQYNGVQGHLVTITDISENDFLYDAFVGPRFASTSGIAREHATPWLALSDAEMEGQWKWMAGPEAGTVASFLNWNIGEPNNCCGGEDYAVMHWQDRGIGTGKWYDYSNPSVYGGHTYIIEYEDALASVPSPATWMLFLIGMFGLSVKSYRS